jgi:hypothetical protein
VILSSASVFLIQTVGRHFWNATFLMALDCRPCLGLLTTAAARPTGTGADGKSNMAGALDRLGSLGRSMRFDVALNCANRRRCAYSRNA